MIVPKALAIWLVILLLAVLNGALREAVLLKNLERSLAFTLSGLILIACILVVTALSVKWIGIATLWQGLALGMFWLVLTLAFESGFGYLRGQSTAVLLDAYRFRDGNIWPIVLVVLATAPAMAVAFHGLVVASGSASPSTTASSHTARFL